MGNSMYELTMNGISKEFSGVPALQGVDFSVRGGEIHALLGANGAGKSTLMKVLSGAYTADSGTIAANEQTLSIRDPLEAKQAGIHCVYQEVDSVLVPQLTVAENIMLDGLSTRGSGLWFGGRGMRQQAEQALQRLGIQLDLQQKAADLALAEKQMVLIARILTHDAKVIIFDEPTAPLSQSETVRLFQTMHQLKQEGVACILITHRLPEVMEHSDRVTVMRDGQQVWTGPTQETNTAGIVQHMLGKTFEEEFPKSDTAIGNVVLETQGLERGVKVRGVDVKVRAGEVLAVVGLVGAGKTELSRLLSGADLPDEGVITLSGQRVKMKQPADAIEQGIVSVPEERRKQGILIDESVERNLSLPMLQQLSSFGWVNRAKERIHGQQLVASLGIKTSSMQQEVKYLSGGNQQKVAIGKWLNTGASVFVFDEPTKGVDIGAKSDIFKLIGELAAAGKAVIYLTCEFAEGLGIGDRIAVMYDGAIVKEFARGEADQERLLLYASGSREE
ncbi:Ribose import ATP-binding protein RbsA [compost metagenome]